MIWTCRRTRLKKSGHILSILEGKQTKLYDLQFLTWQIWGRISTGFTNWMWVTSYFQERWTYPQIFRSQNGKFSFIQERKSGPPLKFQGSLQFPRSSHSNIELAFHTFCSPLCCGRLLTSIFIKVRFSSLFQGKLYWLVLFSNSLFHTAIW